MAKLDEKKQYILKIAIIILIVIILVILSAVIYMLKGDIKLEQLPTEEVMVGTEEDIERTAENAEIERLKSLPERSRIEQYIKKFISYTTDQEYGKAYDLLNNDYKKNYFPTEISFKEYAQTVFTKMVDIEFTNFERNGSIYVSWLTLTDAINGIKGEGIELNFVVKEKGYNNFELSFSKK